MGIIDPIDVVPPAPSLPEVCGQVEGWPRSRVSRAPAARIPIPDPITPTTSPESPSPKTCLPTHIFCVWTAPTFFWRTYNRCSC